MTTSPVTKIEPAKPSRMLAAEVRAEMGRAGVNQTELARRMGVTQPWLSRRIAASGDVDITFEEAVAMAEALGIDPQRLLAALLPRLDSNQQPSGYVSAQVIDLAARRAERAA